MLGGLYVGAKLDWLAQGTEGGRHLTTLKSFAPSAHSASLVCYTFFIPFEEWISTGKPYDQDSLLKKKCQRTSSLVQVNVDDIYFGSTRRIGVMSFDRLMQGWKSKYGRCQYLGRRLISCNVKSKLSWLHLLVKLSMSQLLHVVVRLKRMHKMWVLLHLTISAKTQSFLLKLPFLLMLLKRISHRVRTCSLEVLSSDFGLGEIHLVRWGGDLSYDLPHFMGSLGNLIAASETYDASIVWHDQDQWQIHSWHFYGETGVHVLETVAGEIVYMFADKTYPIARSTLQMLLDHGLEIDSYFAPMLHLLSGGSKLVAVKTLLGLSLVADLIHCYMFTLLLIHSFKTQQGQAGWLLAVAVAVKLERSLTGISQVLLVGSVMVEAHASRLRWTIYLVLLADAAERVRDAIGFEYCLASSSGWTKVKKNLPDINLHVHLEEIKVDKTLCFVEEPVEIIDREVKSLKHSKISIVSLCGYCLEAACASGEYHDDKKDVRKSG
ncbi:hypothetical protein Tco_1401285 [Tanacetum coccineum]